MESIKLATGEGPRFFVFPVFGGTTAPTYAVGSAIASYPLPRELINQTFLAYLIAGSATPSITVQIQGTNDPMTGMGYTAPFTLNSTVAVFPTNPGGHIGFPVNWLGPYALPVPGGSNPYINTIAAGQICLPAMTAPGANITSGTTVSSISATGVTLSGSTNNSGVFQLSFYNNNWVNLGTAIITSAGTPPSASGALVDISAFRWVRANVTAVAGTSPQGMVCMGG